MYEVTFKRKAAKELTKLPRKMLPAMISNIDKLASDPRPAGSKKLKDSEEDLWRIRVGDYRIIYLIDDQIRIVNIRKVGHRKDVYE